MKKLSKTFLILFFLSFIKVNSQSTIESIFLKVPSFDVSLKEDLLKHNNIYKHYSENGILTFYKPNDIPKDISIDSFVHYSIEELLPKYGYMKVSSEYNYGDFSETYEICYWNLKNGNKLVAVTSFSSGTDTYQEIDFYSYKNNNIEKLDSSEIIPTIELEDILNLNQFEIAESDNLKIIFREHQRLNFQLPVEGQNLVTTFDIGGSDLNDRESELRAKIIRKLWKSVLELKWNDGHFDK